jgi:hypothetical protein
LVADAADSGAGMYQLVGYVNGVEIGRADGRCNTGNLGWNLSPSLWPCRPELDAVTLPVSTATAPFVDGPNTVITYAVDYAANAKIATGTVYVDNARPRAAFTAEFQPDDPELITADVADVHSGVAGAQMYYRAVGAESWQPLETRLSEGQARTHVDSSGVPRGQYEFRLTVRDVAGNEFETTLREDGSPMRLDFPLRSAVELRTSLGAGGSSGQTVPYGTSSQVHGRLVDAHGNPLAGQEILVVDHFDNGALFPRAERSVVTDDDGRFATPEPAGPTRSIEATFAGTSKYLPSEDEVGKFAVRGAASFRTSANEIPEGSPIAFAGKVRHHGARIPAGGKLVEIQYRLKTGRQRTLKEPFRTDPAGAYRLVYRFSKALTSDALFHFRVKIRNEGNWPFKGSTSAWRKVIVHAE